MTEEANAGKASSIPGEARVITLNEAAEVLCCSYSTVLRLVTDGELRAFRVRGAWRTTDVICDEYIEQRLAEQRLISQSVEVEK